MKKKIVRFLVCILLFILIGYTVVILNNSNLKKEKYTLLPNEEIENEIIYKNYKYVITKYYDNTTSYSHHNILLNNNNYYYILESLNSCDMYSYIKNNEIYIHCIGKYGDIIKYTLNKKNIKKEILKFNYENTPNISQLHIIIDNIDDEYIYLSSVVKINDNIDEGENVKCSLQTKICIYN